MSIKTWQTTVRMDISETLYIYIKIYLKYNERERMFDKVWGDLLDICTIQVGMLDMIQQSVTPVQPVLQVVDGQTVGPAKQHVTEYLKI